jgi:hypothetical protein
MTKEIYEYLQQYESLLYTSSERNYVMFGSYEVKKKMSEIYSEVFNKKSNMLNSCSTCALREMKALATEYYHMKKQVELFEKEQELEAKDQEVVTETKTKNKRKKE